MEPPSPEFMLLAASLLDALPPRLPVDDALLLQLHAVFGPMLMAALQLIDRREVVRVALPSNRHIYQVASSSGKSYTLYVNPPNPSPSTATVLVPPTPPGSERAVAEPSSSSPSRPARDGGSDPFAITTYDEPPEPPPPPLVQPAELLQEPERPVEEMQRWERVRALAGEMTRMYCPCSGFAHNSLSGGRTVLCKHLLAVVIGRKTSSEVCGGGGGPLGNSAGVT
ncbi:hypothetical protein IAT38_003639 [Cryptococcus sp. DSM 104549]